MSKKILKVGNLIANPGEKIQGNITLKMSDDNIIDIPVTLINGIKEGKTVAITAAVHAVTSLQESVIRLIFAHLHLFLHPSEEAISLR